MYIIYIICDVNSWNETVAAFVTSIDKHGLKHSGIYIRDLDPDSI